MEHHLQAGRSFSVLDWLEKRSPYTVLRVGLEEWLRAIPEFSIKPGETPIYSPGIREVQYLPLVWS